MFKTWTKKDLEGFIPGVILKTRPGFKLESDYDSYKNFYIKSINYFSNAPISLSCLNPHKGDEEIEWKLNPIQIEEYFEKMSNRNGANTKG